MLWARGVLLLLVTLLSGVSHSSVFCFLQLGMSLLLLQLVTVIVTFEELDSLVSELLLLPGDDGENPLKFIFWHFRLTLPLTIFFC